MTNKTEMLQIIDKAMLRVYPTAPCMYGRNQGTLMDIIHLTLSTFRDSVASGSDFDTKEISTHCLHKIGTW